MNIRKKLSVLAGAAVIATMSTGASAEVGAEFSGWAMAVFTTGGLDDGSPCSGGGTEFCGDVAGFGGSATVHVPLNGGLAFSADVLFENHNETHSNASNRDDDANYGAVGLHLINESNSAMPWGGFVFVAGGSSNADSDQWGPLYGLGGEIMVSGFTIQAGGAGYMGPGNSSADTLDSMYFIGVEREFALSTGALTVGAMYGGGDFDEGTNYDEGHWYQISLMYEAPLGSTDMNWFAGYQGDYVKVGSGSGGPDEKAFFHALKVGITIPVGSGAGPFRTPNFRAPFTNVAEMN